MGRYNLKNLPAGFRYLLTIKEIKEIEITGGFKFNSISTGNVTAVGHFKQSDYIQSSFRGVSISGSLNNDSWEFKIYQSGFRNELLPDGFEDNIKSEFQQKIITYIGKIQNSLQTDGIRHPQLWGLVMIIENRVKISWQEHK